MNDRSNGKSRITTHITITGCAICGRSLVRPDELGTNCCDSCRALFWGIFTGILPGFLVAIYYLEEATKTHGIVISKEAQRTGAGMAALAIPILCLLGIALRVWIGRGIVGFMQRAAYVLLALIPFSAAVYAVYLHWDQVTTVYDAYARFVKSVSSCVSLEPVQVHSHGWVSSTPALTFGPIAGAVLMGMVLVLIPVAVVLIPVFWYFARAVPAVFGASGLNSVLLREFRPPRDWGVQPTEPVVYRMLILPALGLVICPLLELCGLAFGLAHFYEGYTTRHGPDPYGLHGRGPSYGVFDIRRKPNPHSELPRFEQRKAAAWEELSFATLAVTTKVCMIAYLCVGAARFFKGKKNAPRTIIYLLLLRVAGCYLFFFSYCWVYGWVDGYKEMKEMFYWNVSLVTPLLMAAIWIPYFIRSHRVKTTFVY